MKTLAVVIAASLALAACASNKTEPSVASTPAAPVAVTAPAAPQSAALSQAEIDAQALKAEVEGLQKKSVYFAFDSAKIAPEYSANLQQQAAFIKAHGQDVVTVSGNADERGSEEYNLALGQKRAAAVQHELKLSGVADNKVKAISYGESQPRLTCHEESCWKENRRVDFTHSLAR